MHIVCARVFRSINLCRLIDSLGFLSVHSNLIQSNYIPSPKVFPASGDVSLLIIRNSYETLFNLSSTHSTWNSIWWFRFVNLDIPTRILIWFQFAFRHWKSGSFIMKRKYKHMYNYINMQEKCIYSEWFIRIETE